MQTKKVEAKATAQIKAEKMNELIFLPLSAVVSAVSAATLRVAPFCRNIQLYHFIKFFEGAEPFFKKGSAKTLLKNQTKSQKYVHQASLV